MADFLYVIRGGEYDGLSPQEMQAHMQSWFKWMEELGKKGNFKAGEPLEETGAVIRGRSKVVTDGPYAESKDMVGGYMLMQAGDLKEAVEISKGCPIFATNGVVEVRPIAKMER